MTDAGKVDGTDKEVIKPRDIITAAAVTCALKMDKGNHVELKSFRVVDFMSKGDNYASYVTSVEVDYCVGAREAETVTYIVKCNPRRTMETLGQIVAFIFGKETVFYTKLVPAINEVFRSMQVPDLRVPKFLYASDESKCELMFFEDMRKKNFLMCDRTKSLDRDHAILVFKELARLHIAGFMMAEKKGGDKLMEQYELKEDVYGRFTDFDSMYVGWYKSIFMNMSETLANIEGYEKAAEALRSKAPEAYSLMKGSLVPVEVFSSICHGDCWTSNLLFRYEDGKPVELCMMDFQVNRYSSVGTDLQYFLYTSLDGNVRRNNLDEFLSIYYSELERCSMISGMKLNFSKQELYREYRARSFFGLAKGIAAVPIILSPPSDAMDMDSYTDAERETFVKKQQEQVQKQMRVNPLLRPRILDMIDEKMEEGTLD